MLKIVAVMPIKLNSERLPGKNIKLLGDKPLLQYELDTLLQIEDIESINVYCSDDFVRTYLPDRVNFVLRPAYLDLPTANFNQIFDSFMQVCNADIYVYAHATAPFITINTIKQCINAVKSGGFDSAFSAVKIQDFLWQNGEPINFDATDVPRSQDLQPIYRETSGIYVFTKDVYLKYHRRIGIRPFIKEISYKEAVDINKPEDFLLAETLIGIEL